MFLFKRTSVAEVIGVGHVKRTEEEGFIPAISIEISKNTKLFNSFYENQFVFNSKLTYFKHLNMLGLTIFFEKKYKIGFQFDPEKHQKTLAGIMKIGKIAIIHPDNGEVFILNIDDSTEGFYQEWKEKVILDIVKAGIKEQGSVVNDVVEHKNLYLEWLENNWVDK